MKKTVFLLLCVLSLSNFVFAQRQIYSTKFQAREAILKSPPSDKGSRSVQGSITTLNRYLPGTAMVLNFCLYFTSPDLEFVDGVTLTFPTGMTPIVTGTSNPIAVNTGCSTATGQLNPISGQTVTWGQTTSPSLCGYLDQGTYNFSVGVVTGNLTGTQAISYTVTGDGHGGTPNSFSGTILVDSALTNDVGPAMIYINPSYQPGVIVAPTVTVQNFGLAAQSFPVSLVINNGTFNIYSHTLNVTTLASGASQQVTFPGWNSISGNYTATATCLLTCDADTSNDTKSTAFVVNPPSMAYAWNLYDPSLTITSGSVEIEIPTGNIAPLAYDNTVVEHADFIYGQWYGSSNDLNNGGSNIYTINKITGTKSLISKLSPFIVGLAFDITSGMLYASVLTGNPMYSLYAINSLTGATTFIAPITNADYIRGIACNNIGELFGVRSDIDKLFSINKTTGVATTIGSLGIDIMNAAQDIAFDRDNGRFFGVFYTNTGLLAEINTSTGAVTILDTLGGQYSGLAIPYQYTLPYVNDMAVQSITSIPASCGLGSTEPIQIKVFNSGSNSQSNIPVYYTVNGGPLVSGIIPGPVESETYATYTFPAPANLSAIGSYTINVCVNMPTDSNSSNNCLSITTEKYQPYTIPFTEGFENNLKGWKNIDANGDSCSWLVWDPTFIPPYSGTRVAAYWHNSDGITGANDWLISNCINLSSTKNYRLNFWYRVGDNGGVGVPNKLKVAIASIQGASAMMSNIINNLGTVSNATYQKSSTVFHIPATGIYYVGWHAYSSANSYYIALDEVNIVEEGNNEIEEPEPEISISIFPNPAKDQISFSSTSYINSICICNALGQKINFTSVDGNWCTIQTDSFIQGVYLVQLETAEGIVNKKIVIIE